MPDYTSTVDARGLTAEMVCALLVDYRGAADILGITPGSTRALLRTRQAPDRLAVFSGVPVWGRQDITDFARRRRHGHEANAS